MMDVDMADVRRHEERQRRAVEALGLSDRDREGDDALLTQDTLEAFQKAAIYRALIDYKRRLSEALEEKESKEKQLSLAKERESALVGLWDGLLESWERLEKDQERRTTLSDTVFAPNALQSSSRNDIRKSLKEIETNATGHLSGLMQRYHQPPVNDGQNTPQQLTKAFQDSVSLAAALAQTRQQAAELKEKNALASEQRHAMARKVDRMEMMMRELKQKVDVASGGESMEGAAAAPGMSRAPSESAAKIPEDQWKRAQGELAEAQLLSEKRAEMIKDLERDLRKARDDIEQLRIQVIMRPNDAQLLSTLKDDLRDKGDENALLREQLQGLEVQVAELKGSQTAFLETIQAEESARRKVLEGDLKRVHADLGRIRKQRDGIQQALDLKKSKEETEKRAEKELKSLVGSQRERIQCLKADLQRLLMTFANDKGDNALLEFFHEKGPVNPFESLRTETSTLKGKVGELERALKAYDDATAAVKEQKMVIDRESALQAQITALETRNIELEKKVGSSSSSSDTELSTLRDQIDFYKKTQEGLMAEIQTLSKSWSELEEQNTRKILNLSKIEDYKLHYKEEKSKMEHKCQLLTREVSIANNAQVALKKQSEKQLELIVKLQDQNKLVSDHLATCEKELALKAASLSTEQLKVSETLHQVTSLKSEIDQVKQKCDSLASLVRSKADDIDSHISQKRKLEDTVSTLKHKVDVLNRDGDSDMREQLDGYKLLLKCSTCNNRFKSHCLLKCMHVFCKECLDDRFNSRQRKCPTCSLAFGREDIRQLFL